MVLGRFTFDACFDRPDVLASDYPFSLPSLVLGRNLEPRERNCGTHTVDCGFRARRPTDVARRCLAATLLFVSVLGPLVFRITNSLELGDKSTTHDSSMIG
jgi:hypothetical protein